MDEDELDNEIFAGGKSHPPYTWWQNLPIPKTPLGSTCTEEPTRKSVMLTVVCSSAEPLSRYTGSARKHTGDLITLMPPHLENAPNIGALALRDICI